MFHALERDILFVERDAEPHELARGLRACPRYLIAVVHSIEDALASLVACRYGLVVADHALSDGPGAQLLRLARKHHALHGARAALLAPECSGMSSEGVCLIYTPIGVPAFLAHVDALLARRPCPLAVAWHP
jgi:DNA-binding response OmpR family regulator